MKPPVISAITDECWSKKLFEAVILHKPLETIQVFFGGFGLGKKIPENGEEELLDRGQRLAYGIIYPDPLAPVFQPAGAFKEGEMSGYGRLGKLQYRHQVTDA
jgi:hypothetical protein